MPKITLRQAGVVQQEIQERLKLVRPEPTAEISIFEDFAGMDSNPILAARAAYDRKLAESETLLEALSVIRAAIGAANAESGVNALLARQAVISVRQDICTTRVRAKPEEPTSVVRQRADRAKGQKESASIYGRSEPAAETITVNLLTAEEISEAAAEAVRLRKERSRIKDKLAEINATFTVTVKEDVWDTLEKAGLV